MKKFYLIFLSIFALLNTALAQKLSVESFVLAPTDITAQTEGRKDLNGDACALVKIFVVGEVADVEGNVVKPLVKKNSQTWVFMTQGSKQMQVIVQNALPMIVTFADYGIGKLEGNRTYILTLSLVDAMTSVSLTSTSTRVNSSQSPSSSISSPSGTVISIPVKDGVKIEMVKVEAGTFMMGATPEMEDPHNSDKPVHRVTLTSGYYIGKYEVSQYLWEVVMGENPSEFKYANLPVENVSWYDCQEFIAKLNRLTGETFRLPTEAEWEYAARGGNKSRGFRFSGSNYIDDVAWYSLNSDYNRGVKPHPIGDKQPNELGIYDMTGNVEEWCQDWYGSYNDSSQTNPFGPVNGTYRVRRGGSIYTSQFHCFSSSRFVFSPEKHAEFLGFRLALSE